MYGEKLEDLIRQIVREELAAAGLSDHAVIPSEPGTHRRLALAQMKGRAASPKQPALTAEKGTDICGATKGSLVCLKEPHKGRHKFVSKPHESPPRDWEPIEEFTLRSGTRSYAIKVGNPVKVAGLGKLKTGSKTERTVGDGFRVVSMERSTTDPRKINVAVVKGRGESPRVVSSDRIIYKRPSRTPRETP